MSYQPLSSRVSGDVDHPQHNHHTQASESTERGLEDTVSLTSTTDTLPVLQDDRRSQRASIDASEEVPSIPSFATPSHTSKSSIEYQEDAIATGKLSDMPSTTNASNAGHDVKTLTGWWWWEILATLVSVICMVLLIALLCVIRETPLSRWTWQLEPNSVISILTTDSKTALMVPVAACLSQLKWKHVQQPQPLSHMQVFDDASRGPYGSLIMAWKLRFRSPVGWALAFVTIVALGIGPSAQNVLWIHNAEVEFTNTSGNVAEIGRADAIYSKAFTRSKYYDRKSNEPATKRPSVSSNLQTLLCRVCVDDQQRYACDSSGHRQWINRNTNSAKLCVPQRLDISLGYVLESWCMQHLSKCD
ncbi:hypothetical protein CPLU01_10399 [Colletotrichum plurivorum]|uniref:Uncharacterized protein n=1 Tax=Colletotrichum plurivorum TaxID=2175906 RepID=A0A8H6K5N6_9PEZI|nr:hypothetical protein CPLU01_10399 [Colletotrichum plurivorum]